MELSDIQLFILAIGAMGMGTVLLIRGGDWTIDAAVHIAQKIGISPLVVGFTIIAFGTSLPELFVSVNANLKGSPGIAIGNVLGSNVANILLVIGAAALVAPLVTTPKAVRRDIIMMILATLLMMGLFFSGSIPQMAGGLMILALMGYVFWQYLSVLKGDSEAEEIDDPEFSKDHFAYIYLLAGLVFVSLGAEFLVNGAQVSATILGVPEAVIALSLIAIGTSLPELSTCLAAAKKGESDIILGNIIGSNFFNIMMIIGATSLVKTIDMADVGREVLERDIWVVLAVALAFSIALLTKGKIGKTSGYVYLTLYVIYMAAIYLLSGSSQLSL